MENTTIAWATHSFNPFRGCTKISEGCKFCYAHTLVTTRHKLPVWGAQAPRKIASESMWKEPIRWNKKAIGLPEKPRVFSASLADVFEDYQGPDRVLVQAARVRLFRLIEVTTALQWMVLTKRTENIKPMVHEMGWLQNSGAEWPSNLWIGFSAENQECFDERWAHAKNVPAPVIFCSMEPLLGPIVLPDDFLSRGQRVWPILGGESGHKARPCDRQWIRGPLKQCQRAQVPAFVKQMGARSYDGEIPGQIIENEAAIMARDAVIGTFCSPGFKVTGLDKKGGDPGEWPAEYRVRQVPRP